jgi:hypothetical protein
MDVTPELIWIANNARRKAMARVTIRKIEYPETSAFWQIIEESQTLEEQIAAGPACDATFTVHRFEYERKARDAFDRIIMGAVLAAVANHLVKGQTSNPSQAA